jgi:hypothetical protein
METEIEIHVLKDGTQMITAMVAGRPIAMTSFEWQLFCRDMLGAIETHLTKRSPDSLTVEAICPRCCMIFDVALPAKSG